MAFLTCQHWLRLALVLLGISLAPAIASAEALQLHEQEIKAALLYNFLKYTDWPQHDSSMVVCIFGDDPFDGYLNPMAKRTVNQRVIALRQLKGTSGVEGCHLLFINANQKSRWPELRRTLADKNILTVSDFSGFAEDGGMIEFSHKGDHISAILNTDAATSAGLRVQDRLLRLVTVMHPSPKS